jgi:diketogulonate reductase-like aldo/keto reductase
MREFLAANHSVKRSDIFITTKVWNHLHEPADVEWSLKNSLEKLQTPYVDGFLVHWPIAAEKNEDRTVKIGADGKVTSLKKFSPQLGANAILVCHQERSHRKS